MAFPSYEEVKKQVCEGICSQKLFNDVKGVLDVVFASGHVWGFERALDRVRDDLSQYAKKLRDDNIISEDAYYEIRRFIIGTLRWCDEEVSEEVEDV